MKSVGKVRWGSGNATAIRIGWREGVCHVPWTSFWSSPVRIIQVWAPWCSGGCAELTLESIPFIAAFTVIVWYKTPVLQSLKIQIKLVRSYPCFSATTPSAKPSKKWIYGKSVTNFWLHRGGNIHLPVPAGEVLCRISGEDQWAPPA